MKLVKDSSSDRYIFHCAISDRFPARDAGFQFNSKGAPGVWSTDSARRALKLAAYADDDLRDQIIRDAQNEPDPDRITLTFDGQTYRYFSPFAYKELAKQAGMQFAKHPRPCWWTADAETAIRCFNNAAQYEGIFECAEELRAQLENHIDRRNASLDASRALDAEIEIPAPPGCEYLGFQKAGVRFMLARQNTLVGDPTGVGKTIETLGFINAIDAKKILIISPNSLKVHWRDHCAGNEFKTPKIPRWLVDPSLTVGLAESQFWPKTDVVIVNYEALGRASVGGKKVLRREIREGQWDVLIWDESHWLKSPKAQRTKFATAIEAKRILALSATPNPNRVRELWSVIHRLDPVAFPDFWPFAKRYCGLTKTPFGWDTGGASNLSELQAKLRSTILLRREKREVLKDLPPKRRQVIELPAANLKRIVDAEQTTMEQHQELLAELRARAELAKASSDPAEYQEAASALREGQKVAFTEMSALRYKTAVATLPLAIEHLTDLLEGVPKILIGAHHVDIIDQLCEVWGTKHAKAIYGAGNKFSTTAEERQGVVDWFNNDPEARLLVCQFDTGGVGFSVRTAYAVAVEHCWVPGILTQWEDRCSGINRGIEGEPLLIQHLVLEGSLTVQQVRTCIAKQEIADRALDRRGGIDLELDDVDTEFEEENLVLPKKALACTDDSVQYSRPATYDVKREQVQREAEALSQEQIQLIHFGLRTLAGLCDGAASIDGQGFNSMDSRIGKSLARCQVLSGPQAALGKKILARYKNTQILGIVDSLFV